MAKKKNSRASNGMGSIRQRADGRWEGRYSAPDGKQKSVYGTTEREVTAKLRATLHEIDSGAWKEPSKMTVGEWLDIWLRDYQGHTTGRTVETYKGIVERHFKSTFGDVKMSVFSQMHVRRMVADMQKKGRAASTIRHSCAILGGAMKCAIEAGIIKDNPVVGLKLPRKAKTKFTVVDRDMIPAFVEAAEQTDYPNELLFMLYTGSRVGEVRGLRWDDVDLEAGTANICRQLHAVTHGKRFAPPKDGEEREIHLPAEAVDALKRQRRRQLEQRLAAGDKWVEDDISRGLVFRQTKGKAHSELSIFYATKEAGKAIGLPELHPHDLRHSYAVAALRSGVDVKTVQHNLGHKSASITLDIYAAYTTDAGKEGAKKLSEYLKNAGK